LVTQFHKPRHTQPSDRKKDEEHTQHVPANMEDTELSAGLLVHLARARQSQHAQASKWAPPAAPGLQNSGPIAKFSRTGQSMLLSKQDYRSWQPASLALVKLQKKRLSTVVATAEKPRPYSSLESAASTEVTAARAAAQEQLSSLEGTDATAVPTLRTAASCPCEHASFLQPSFPALAHPHSLAVAAATAPRSPRSGALMPLSQPTAPPMCSIQTHLDRPVSPRSKAVLEPLSPRSVSAAKSQRDSSTSTSSTSSVCSTDSDLLEGG
jgi:hypothetical protein